MTELEQVKFVSCIALMLETRSMCTILFGTSGGRDKYGDVGIEGR
jgi:hypothetical protein